MLEQNTKYNIRYEIIIPDRVYNIYVTDTASGTTTLAHSGIISDEFDDIKLLNFYINKNYSPVWTIDNIVVDYNSSHTPALVINEENIEVSEGGTITFGAILPEGYSSGDIYINDVFSTSIFFAISSSTSSSSNNAFFILFNNPIFLHL